MTVSIVGTSCYVYREPGDPVFRPNRSRYSWSPPGWYGAESRLLHHVQRVLNGRGYDLIKKRIWRDGHMFGSDQSQYLRSRDLKAVPSLYIYHADYALEVAAESFNVLGRVELEVAYGAGREDDAEFERASREWVQRLEAAHPCYEVLWDGEATIDGHTAVRRLYRGFHDLESARAFVATDPGDSCRLIDRRTGEDPKPIQLAHAVRSLTEDYGMTLKQVAGRLKRSEAWLSNLLDLVMLPSAIQASVASGETPVSAALELVKLPTDQQVAVFDSLAQGGEKITASKVKAKRQEVHEATGEGGPVPRTLKQLKAFLEGKTGPTDPGHRLASYLLDYLAGRRTDESMDRYWDRAFAEPTGSRMTG